MKLQLNDNLTFETLLKLEDQSPEVQEHIGSIAYDISGANPELSNWQGTGEPGQPIRYERLVHDIPTLEGAVIRTTAEWAYHNPYGHPAAFAAKSITFKTEVLHG